MSFKFVILLFCLLMVTRSRAENPLSRFLMKKMSSKDESKMKSSIHSDVVKHGSESSVALYDANETDQVAGRAEETLNSLERALDDAQASHKKASTNQKSAEEKVKALETELLEFRAVATSHLEQLIEEANRHQTQRIAAVVQEYDQRFSDLQRLSENALTDANAVMAQKDAVTAEHEARNVELEIQLKRAEAAHEKARKAEQESVARMNDLEKQLEDLRANMAAEMKLKAHELTTLKTAYDDIAVKGQNELELAKAARDVAVEAEQKAIDKVKGLEQASEVIRAETAEMMDQPGGQVDTEVTQRIASMADAQVQSENALIAAKTELMKREEDLAALKMDYEQLKHQDQEQLKLAENARDTALEMVLNLQKEFENLLAETKTKMDEVTKEADERISQRITEVEKEYAQRLADAQQRAGQDLLDAEHALISREEGLAVLKARYEEQNIKSLTQLELAEAARDAAVEAGQKATEKMKELEHASEVLLSETQVNFEQRISEIDANTTQRIHALTDARDQSERALTAAKTELIEKEMVIAKLKMDYEQIKYQDQHKLELAESARDDALERVQYLQQEYDTLLEKTKVEIMDATKAADNRVAQFAINTEQHYAQRLTDAQEQAKHDLVNAKGELAAKEEELAAILVENEELKTAEATANRRISELERNATKRLVDARSYFEKELDDANAEVAKKEAQLTALRAEYDFIAFDSRTQLENAESERNVAIEEMNKALQTVKELAQVEQDYIWRLTEVQTLSKEALADATATLERKEHELAVLKDEYDDNSARDKKQLELALSSLDAAIEAKEKALDEVQKLEAQSDKTLADVIRKKDEELTALAVKLGDAQALYDEQLDASTEDMKLKEEELAILNEKFDEAEARYREDILTTMLEVEKNKQELAALQAEYTVAHSRSEQDISTAKKEGKEKEKELMALKEAFAVKAADLEVKLEETKAYCKVVESQLELSQKEAQYWADNFSSRSYFNLTYITYDALQVLDSVRQEGLHRIEEARAFFKDSTEKSVALLMTEGQTITTDHYANKSHDLYRQTVDTIADQSSQRHAAHVVHEMIKSVHVGMDSSVYTFFLDCFDKIVVHVRIHCPLVESDLKASGPLWVHDIVQEACLEPREAVACFFKVVCMFSVFLIWGMLWKLLWGTILKFSPVISLFSSTRIFGSSEGNNSAIKESTFPVGRRLRGSPKKRPQ